MNIRNIQLHELKPYERNAKIHSVKQLEGIAQSIQRFGFLQPLVVDKNNVIVAGHGRYEAAAALGMLELPCVTVDDLSEAEIRAYRLLDNKLAETGTDLKILNFELSDLHFDFSPFKVEFKSINLDLKPLSEGEVAKEIREICKECEGTGYLD